MALASIDDLNGPPEEVEFRIEQAKKLSDLYNDFIDFDQEDGHHRTPGIHASELYPCMRKAVYACLDTPKKNKVSKFWKQRFKVGHAIHNMVQADFHRMAKKQGYSEAITFAGHIAAAMNCSMSFEAEVPVSPKLQKLAERYNLHSSCDGVFTFTDLDSGIVVLRVGLEIKSKSQDEYAKLRVPEEQHVAQAHIYMANLDLPLMWFFYMNKSNQNNTNSSAPFLMVWQPDVWQKLEERCRTVLALVERKELPPRTEFIGCEFCPWSYTCKPSIIHSDSPQRQSRRESIRGPALP
jgi:CRISPR/Cas system-associated exonuclease Cas4 (RecB family)